jgi:hypoxanthine-DNA glycosylase
MESDIRYRHSEESLQVRKSGLPPVLDENTEILILGWLPSDTSLSTGQYDADPRSDFLEACRSSDEPDLHGLSYVDKLELLKPNRIGLWNAYHACLRPGSMDKDITEKEPNDFTVLKGMAPNIRFIASTVKRRLKPRSLWFGWDTKRASCLHPAERTADTKMVGNFAGRLRLVKSFVQNRRRPELYASAKA